MFELVDEYVSIMAKNLELRSRTPSEDVWPNPLADITLANDISGEYILKILEEIFCFSDDLEMIAKSFRKPSKLVYLMYLFTLKPENEIIAHNRMRLAEKMISAISILRNGNPFIKGNKNILITDDNIFDEIYFENDLSENVIRLIRKIMGALASINEYSYFAWVGIGREFHGIYNYKNRKLFIREYFDLKPDFWEYTKYIPWKSISIITEETEDTKPIYDFNGRMYFEKTNNFKGIGLVLDGISMKITEQFLQDIFEKLMYALMKAKEEAKCMSANEILLQYVRAQFFALRDSLGKMDMIDKSIVPKEIEKAILNISGKSSFDATLQKLIVTEKKEKRIDLLKDFLNPGNTNKLG